MARPPTHGNAWSRYEWQGRMRGELEKLKPRRMIQHQDMLFPKYNNQYGLHFYVHAYTSMYANSEYHLALQMPQARWV